MDPSALTNGIKTDWGYEPHTGQCLADWHMGISFCVPLSHIHLPAVL